MDYIVEYRDEWARSFLRLVELLKRSVQPKCRFHHVGSTAILGMPAKDIIDIDIECPQGNMTTLIEDLRRTGYQHQGNLGVPSREAFRILNSDLRALPAHHLYACEVGSPELMRHLAFRDFLAANPGKALWLAERKRLHDEQAVSREDYIERKSSDYAAIVQEAIQCLTLG
jgi:GrpB-like predicted nucleotidyltransferase (UPF0157 family)